MVGGAFTSGTKRGDDMTSGSGWRGEPASDVDADELRRRSSAQWDYSTKGAWADVVSTFGGVVLLIGSAMGALQGLSAIANDDLYSEGSDYLYKFDMQVWGTVHLVIAALSAIVAVGVLARKSWGQMCGIIVAGLSVIGNFAFLPHYPLWSLTLIALDALVIWALLTQLGHDT
jgi:hypothetical protein